jgi:glycosyltransferase involved in cell wall biosynthesis
MGPKVSIMMAVYNGEKYIGEAIASVIAQTFQDWELLIVNDGSTDNTVDVVQSFQDARIHLFHQANSGPSIARNTAIDHARGDYLAYLDSDDVFLPNHLEILTGYLESHPEVGVVYSDGYYCAADLSPVATFSEYRPQEIIGRSIDQIVLTPLLAAPCCSFVRMSIIRNNNIRFDPDLPPAEDWDFFIRLAEVVDFHSIPIVTCKYRIHQTNITSTMKVKNGESKKKIRLRALHSDYFASLSEKTQYSLLINLCLDSFGDQPEEQVELLASKYSLELSKKNRSSLLRQVSLYRIIKNCSNCPSRNLIINAIYINPFSYKNWGALFLQLLPKSISIKIIRMYRGTEPKRSGIEKMFGQTD